MKNQIGSIHNGLVENYKTFDGVKAHLQRKLAILDQVKSGLSELALMEIQDNIFCFGVIRKSQKHLDTLTNAYFEAWSNANKELI